MRKTVIIIHLLILLFAMLLSSCVKDDCYLNDTIVHGTRITLSLGDMPVIETRSVSVASTTERTISDAYLLVFDSAGKYKNGEQVDVDTDIAHNGDQQPVLTTELTIENGDKVVILCNTGVTEMPTFTVGASTANDINEKFNSLYWNINQTGTNSGKGMPMSGAIDWSDTPQVVTMHRSVAKVQLLLDIPTDADITSTFTAEAVEWGMYNVVQNGNIYSNGGTSSIPSTVTFANCSTLPQRVVGASGASNHQETYYMPEYPSSIYAKTSITTASAFAADRTCLIVHTMAGYYRIDLALGNRHNEDKVFLDINRNFHYKVTITKVNSIGYTSVTEALDNPSANLEYEIVVVGDNDNYVTSNGQYALISNKNNVVLLDDINDVTLNFSLKTVETVNITTAYIEIVKLSQLSYPVRVSMPECFTIVKSGTTEELSVQSGEIQLGTLTGDTQFALYANLTADALQSISSLEGSYFHIVMGNVEKYIPISITPDLDIDNVKMYSGTSNCYEVDAGGSSTHTFEITSYLTDNYLYKNYGGGDLVIPKSAAMLWSDVSQQHISETSIAYNALENTYSLTFTTTGDAGNAVIAIYDNTNPSANEAKIIWSYHIWVRTRSEDNDQLWSVVNTTDSCVVHKKYYMMEFNLGATSNNIATSTDNSSFGLYYQWGRKDPFVGGNSNATGLTTIYSPSGVTTQQYIESTAEVGTITYATEHPKTFIFQGTATDTRQDWLFAECNHSLWGNPNQSTKVDYYPRSVGEKSIYDPCPTGYCVPPQDAFTMIIKADRFSLNPASGIYIGTQAGRNIIPSWDVAANNGACFYYQEVGSGLDTYLPFAGFINRTQGEYSNAGAFYWTNTNTTRNNYQGSRASFYNSTWNPIWVSGRAMGHSVRCMREVK